MATRRVADAAGATRRIKKLTAEARGSRERGSLAKVAGAAVVVRGPREAAGAERGPREAERAERFGAWLEECPAEWRDFFEAP